MDELADKLRRICARLLDVPLDSSEGLLYCAELKRAAAQFAEQQKQWNKPSHGDNPQGEARQSYRSRETDSADGFASGLKLFKRTKRSSDSKKND